MTTTRSRALNHAAVIRFSSSAGDTNGPSLSILRAQQWGVVPIERIILTGNDSGG